MSTSNLSPTEARAIIRRHVHDLRNMLNCMDLEIACLLEEPDALPSAAALGKLRHQLTLTEGVVRSLSVRFVEPSLNIAAATDLFYYWRQQLEKMSRGPQMQWEEFPCDAAITVDFTAVVTVLCEMCLEAKSGGEESWPAGGMKEAEGEVTYYVRMPASERTHRDTAPESQQWAEWERLIVISGGHLARSYEGSGHTVTSVGFPVLP